MTRERLDVSQYPEAERLALAARLIATPIIANQENLDIIATTPYAQNCPRNEIPDRLLTVKKANEVLPELRSAFSRITISQAFRTIEDLLKSSSTNSFGFEERQFQIAIAHIGVEMAAGQFKSAEEEQRKVMLSCVHYFAALESLYVGIRTNTLLFAVYPEQTNPEILQEIVTLVEYPTAEELARDRVRIIFEGHLVSPIESIKDDVSYFSVK